ncbi:hypothetical protein [Burkholderia multivorans]|uniref:hypothetical protein n=1 Tax=Burkholderia multivorans TaxID=87883 RepID=UPI001561B7B8|nr:hypothetical protein [Burkholderia multivorans]MBU9120043.1 hypothetical protein [Burkholderia multivorans]
MQNELKLQIELAETRMKLMEAQSMVLHFQHQALGVQLAALKQQHESEQSQAKE